MGRVVLLLVMLAGCAETQPAGRAPASHRTAPSKCSACHPAPQEHGLASSQWEEFLRNHRRRIRLTDGEKNALHDFLIGGDRPAAQVP